MKASGSAGNCTSKCANICMVHDWSCFFACCHSVIHMIHSHDTSTNSTYSGEKKHIFRSKAFICKRKHQGGFVPQHFFWFYWWFFLFEKKLFFFQWKPIFFFQMSSNVFLTRALEFHSRHLKKFVVASTLAGGTFSYQTTKFDHLNRPINRKKYRLFESTYLGATIGFGIWISPLAGSVGVLIACGMVGVVFTPLFILEKMCD